MAVDNRAPWDIFREGKDEEREPPGTLFGTHLRPMAVDNRAPWDIFRERKDEEREPPGTLFGTHLRPMGLNVLGYQAPTRA